MTPHFYNLFLYSTKTLQLHYSATDVKGGKNNLEATLRHFLSFTADPKQQFIQVSLLSGTGKFFAGENKIKKKKKVKLTSNTDAAC